jgi:hypothetical protein
MWLIARNLLRPAVDGERCGELGRMQRMLRTSVIGIRIVYETLAKRGSPLTSVFATAAMSM